MSSYDNAWSANIVSDSTKIKDIDDKINRVLLDVEQRMDTILGNNSWSGGADPVIDGTAILNLLQIKASLDLKPTINATNNWIPKRTAAGVLSDAFNAPGSQIGLTRFDAGDTATGITIDWNNGNIQRCRMTGANVTFTLNNPVVGATYILELLQDSAGSRVATWPAEIVWEGGLAPTLTTTLNRKDIIVLFWNSVVYFGGIFGLNFVDTT